MYTLLSGLVEWATAKEEVRVILLGLDSAGKTTTLQALRAAADRRARGRHAMMLGGGSSSNAAEPLPKARPTVGLNVGRLDAAGAAVMLWDLGGAAGLRVIWDRYIRDAHGIIFVVDASNPARFAEARAVLERLASSPDAAGAPLLIVANKEDARGAASAVDVAAALGPVAREGAPGAPVRPKVVSASAVATALGGGNSSSLLVSVAARNNNNGGGEKTTDTTAGSSGSSSSRAAATSAATTTATASGAAAAAAASNGNSNGTLSDVDVGSESLEEALRWIVDASRRGARAEMLRERAAAGS